MKTLRLLLLVFLLPISNFSQELPQEKLSPRTAYFMKSLLQSRAGAEDTENVKKRFGVSAVTGQDKEYAGAFIYFDEGDSLEELEALDVEFTPMLPGMATARIPLHMLGQVTACTAIKRIEIASPVYPHMDEVRLVTNTEKVHAGENLKNFYTGKDVIVGVIDQGFQYSHINFFDNQQELKIKRVWRQNVSGNKPAGFNYGSEYITSDAILDIQYDFHQTTHGTHVAGIAAGADRNGEHPYYGVSPEADLVLVSYYSYDIGTDNVYISDAVKYIFDYAESVGKPCVVNISLGTHLGPHDGTSAFDRLCDALQGEGRLLVGSAGNEGNKNIHLMKEFTAPDDTLKTFVAFRNSSDRYGEIDIWSEPGKAFGMQVVVYKKNTGQELFTSPVVEVTGKGEYTFALENDLHGCKGTVDVMTEINPANNKANAYVAVNLNNMLTGNYIGLKIISREEGTVNAWADNLYSYFFHNRVEGWEEGDNTSSVAEIGGTGNRIISVGAFSSKEKYINTSGKEIITGQTVGEIAGYSGRGPTADGRMKPDIAAPGSVVVSSYSDLISFGNRILVNTVNNRDYFYGAMDGTSMAAPVVTGILAAWLEAKNDLTPEEVREILEKTAVRDSFNGDATIWGYGKIDAWAGLREIEGRLSGIKEIVAEDVCKVFPNPVCSGTVYISVGEEHDNVLVTISGLKGEQVYCRQMSGAQLYGIDVGFLPAGIYLLTVKGNNFYHIERLIVL